MDNESKIEQDSLYDLKNRKIQAKKLMNEFLSSKEKENKILDEIMTSDDTLPDIYFYKLLNNHNNIKLKEISYDVLDKDLLVNFNMEKKFNYREIYFELIDYISSITLDEPETAADKFELEEFIMDEDENEDSGENLSNNEKKFDYEIENNVILKVDVEEKSDLDENLSVKEFEDVLEKKMKFDIKKILKKNETIKVEDIKIKFSQIFEECCSFINYKNNYPDFESEFFYFNCLRYMLNTYKSLKYKRFINKLGLTESLSPLTDKIKNSKIDDYLTKFFYYYIMNTQYYLDPIYLELLKKNSNFKLNNDYIIKNNNLYQKTNENEIILKEADNYLVNDLIEDNMLYSNKKYVVLKNYISFKGLLNNLSFKKEEGDKYWDEFLSSNMLNDLVMNLYKQENIFNQKYVIDLFKERSYYFPNFNTSFLTLSHKELFNMYFPPTKIEVFNKCLNNSFILEMINKSGNKIKIQHEWGHISSYFLFFTSKNKYFTTPERKIKFENNSKEKIIKEGGKAVEILLYGRIIEDLNAKEAIFILNNNNNKLSLDEYRKKFIALENRKLIDVFEEAKNNKNIDDCVIKAYEEYLKKDKDFQFNLENYSFKLKIKKNEYYDLDKISFKLGKNYHHKIKRYIPK